MRITRRALQGTSGYQCGSAANKSGGWRNFWLPLLIVLLPLAGEPLRSQQAPPISVEVKMVSMLATVRDKHGSLIRNLTKDDFVLEQDGHPQTISYFAKESDLPLTLGLLVDTSMSQRRVLDQERSASHAFLDHVLREDKDKAFVIHFDHEVELLQDLTAAQQKLEQALDEVQTSAASQSSGNSSPNDDSGQGPPRRGGGRYFHGGGAQLYDAVYLASNELMEKQPGRKILIVFSDGVDRGSKETLDNALESAQRANTILYAILDKENEAYEGGGNRGGFGFPGMGGPMGGGMGRRGAGGYPPSQQESRPDGKKVLQRMSGETGGRLLDVSKKLPLDQIYSSIEEDLRSQYNISYTPAPAEENGAGCHKIQLTSKKKDAVVQARSSYCSESGR